MPAKKNPGNGKKVTRYTYDDVKEPRTSETGHTPLLPSDELVVTLPMDNGWSKAIQIGKLPEGDERPVALDMDPVADPVLFWSGKRNRREVPVLGGVCCRGAAAPWMTTPGPVGRVGNASLRTPRRTSVIPP